MMDKCLIVSGAPDCHIPELRGTEFVIACDYGYRHAMDNGIRPDLVLGDFDSLGAVPEHLPHMTVPVEKDDTDTMLAVRVALEKGFRDIRIYGAFGGRLDHTLANLQTLEYLRLQGADGFLAGVSDCARMLCGGETLHLKKRPDWSLSLFAWSERCEDVSAAGVYYPLAHGTLTRSFPLGVSNHITAAEAEISCGSGMLLVMQSKL